MTKSCSPSQIGSTVSILLYSVICHIVSKDICKKKEFSGLILKSEISKENAKQVLKCMFVVILTETMIFSISSCSLVI